ncbi:uncharacterized protein CXorf58 homolog isoform X2 [Physella acuta]|uniref:uncharacterized protein CXorf58 homolog isoform X2 n=1 Tax=Physella acuta TaxID=109671 RepID=UPI0027DC591D|nr:uncharacterized protein CXorf58 homolog isoform X2 [Physella acuta]
MSSPRNQLSVKIKIPPVVDIAAISVAPTTTERTKFTSDSLNKLNYKKHEYVENNKNMYKMDDSINIKQETRSTDISTSFRTFENQENFVQETKFFSDKDRSDAARAIERAWISYRDKQMFKLLKHSICAAESSLSYEILRKVCPREAEFFKDRSQEVRVRFRFGGSEFPPMIFFKIFVHSKALKVKYLSGRKMIKPLTEAASDALQQMGNRNFYQQILQDTLQHNQRPVCDEVDVTTMKDYMQYLSNLDESPACQGGKENYWRRLTLDVLSRHTMFFDVVDYAYNNHISESLRKEMALLLTQPVTEKLQLQHIHAISKLRMLTSPSYAPPCTSRSSHYSSRRNKRAVQRAMKMRQFYSKHYQDQALTEGQDDCKHYNSPRHIADGDTFQNGDTCQHGDSGDDWDYEADNLYEWSQGLSLSDEDTPVPF